MADLGISQGEKRNIPLFPPLLFPFLFLFLSIFPFFPFPFFPFPIPLVGPLESN